MTTAKPQLRGLLASATKVNLAMTFLVGFGSALAFKIFVADARKKQFADFYKTYDADKAFRVMRNAGLLQSVGPE